jgi:hypothetical protein
MRDKTQPRSEEAKNRDTPDSERQVHQINDHKDLPPLAKIQRDAATLPSRGPASEPLLGIVQNEKMVYVNDIGMPILEESLPAGEVLERAGFAPSEYLLRITQSETGSKERVLKAEQLLEIRNNMRATAVLKPQ